ncbi:MAG: type 1 glutamine amidotransferase [Nitrospinae bacterium]|nr:type 1 glutamine amidotransferase [Nitrospinota bacterium]
MNILVIKNVGIEGPGTLGAFLKKNGYGIKYVDFEKGQKLPATPEEFPLVLFMGGPMNVYEEEKFPFLADELKFIEQCLKRQTKIIGLCLGGQMIARALGAKVKKNHKKEIGWYDLDLTAEGKNEPLVKGLPESFKVFQWHGDTFDIPSGAKRLASSELCANQAFVYENALALQFHAEIDGEKEVKEWAELYLNELKQERGEKGMELILAETRRQMPILRPHAETFYQNILHWITGK